MNASWLKAVPLSVALCIAGPAWPMGGGSGGEAPSNTAPALEADWRPLSEEGRGYSALQADWEHTVAHLAGAGLTAGEGNQVLAAPRQAIREGLPAEAVLAKLDEGASKGVSAKGLLEAAKMRLAALQRARKTLQKSEFPAGEERGQGLLVATAFALESGLPEPMLTSVLQHGRGTPPGRMKAVVEAGEALLLEGLTPETVQDLMKDCLDRQLRRPELLRVVRFAREQHGRGMDGGEIRSALWGGAGGMGGMQGGSGSGEGPGDGQGPSVGPGMGGPGGGGLGNMGGNRPPRGGPR